MKKTQILAAAALLLLAGACTKNFEQYNANPYGVTNEEMLRDGYALRAALNDVYCDEKVGDYILEIVFKTRERSEYVQNGASPRATLALNLAARGNALLHGRAYATPQDVKEVVHDVLRHRILLTYEAEAENVTSDKIIDKILSVVPVP